MNNIKIRSINIRGLRNKIKRKTFFNVIKRNHIDIVCVQEAYITDEDIDLWEREWGGKMFYYPGTKHSLGQIILVKNNFKYDIKCVTRRDRLLAIEINLIDSILHIANIYAPNDSNEKRLFYDELKNYSLNVQTQNIIFCGDVNCVVDNKIDIISGNTHPKRDIDKLNEFLSVCDLFDVWRLFHAEEKEFTWSLRSPFIARRIDYCFATELVVNQISECNIVTIAKSDHRAVDITYKISNVKRGPSYWKFNDSLLDDRTFITEMNKFITTFKIEHENEHNQVKWELLKIKIREFCISFSKEKQKNRNDKIKLIEKELSEIDRYLSSNPTDLGSIQKREELKKQLDIFNVYIASGAHIRSRAKFIADGEKNTAYFLSLEKAQGNARILDSIKKDNGHTVTDQSEILKEITEFYKQRYKGETEFDEVSANTFLNNLDIPTLSEEEKTQLETNISEKELGVALKGLNSKSSPGSDGLTAGFYKFFWGHIKDLVYRSITTAYENGEMSYSQKKAIITLIHKGKDLSKENLNNWRPISLTNTDYKIIAKVLANRLTSVIDKLIDNDQVGFMKGRNISTVIRTIDDTISYLGKTKQPGIIFALDYKAAFDTISKQFILWAFKQFNFGENYIKWVKTIMENTKSHVNYLGWISPSIDINSGIRQGCPYSPMAFVLALEILAIKIRNDENIKGIKLPNISQQNNILKILLYADDITLFLQERVDLKNALTLVTYFSKFSGLAMNRAKSEAMWTGSNHNNEDKPYEIKWTKSLKILGVYFENETPASYNEKNWINRIEKINKIISQWYKRNLSLMAKICITKTLLISQLVFILQSLAIPDDILTKINTIIFRFIWKKKYTNTKAFEKVKRKTICKTTEQGGLNMINIKDMQNSFLLTWVTKLKHEKPEKWKIIPTDEFSNLGANLACFNANVNSKQFKGINLVRNDFWKAVLKSWLDNLKELNEHISNNTEFKSQILWNNTHLVHRNNTLFFKDWIEAGITKISDMEINGNIETLDNIYRKVGYKPSRIFEYGAIITAITNYRNKQINNTQNETTRDPQIPTNPQQFRKLLVDKDKTEPKAVGLWQRRLNLKIDSDTWLIAKNCSRETRLRLLHFKILYGIYPTNKLLHKMDKADSIYCTYCTNDIDTLEHFFFECKKIACIWKLAENEIFLRTNIHLSINIEEAMLGIKSKIYEKHITNIANHIILIVKMCIGIYKYGTPIDIKILFERELNLRNVYMVAN